MRLQAKFTAVFALAALTPILFATLLVRVTIRRTSRDAAQRILDDAGRSGEAQFRALSADVQAAARTLADPTDREMAPVLLELAKGTFDDEKQRELAHRAPAMARERGVDVLEILDAEGHILGCGHAPARVGESDLEALRRANRFAGQPLLVEERVLEDGRLVPAVALEAVHWVRSPLGTRLVVLAGRLLGQRFCDGLHQDGRVEARLVTPDGATEIAGPPEDRWARARRHSMRVLELAGADHVVRARLELAVSYDELRSVLEGITQASTLVAIGALLLALGLGAFVARRITRPVRELSRGAAAIAHGELDVRLEVTSRKDELWDLVRAFDQMVSELEQSKAQLVQAERVAAWREIARRLAHEIKNPLTPIQMSIETMRKTRGRPEAFDEIFDEGTRTILAEVARLKHIVQEFSDFARMPKPTLQLCNLAEVARGALALYSGGQTAVRAELDEKALPEVMADRHQIQQVLLNLLENARDAVRRKGSGEIVVRTRRATGAVELEVEDEGVGLSESVRQRLFTPYFTTKENGTGLGLAIVQRIVSDHGGRVTVSSREGRGATFTLWLPLQAASTAPPAEAPPAPASAAQ